jgi:carboxypeptidase C (cathepsin A)
MVDTENAGQSKVYENLELLKLLDAGHMVPYD